jgi:hypothetical protein
MHYKSIIEKCKAPLITYAVYTGGSSNKPKNQKTAKTPTTQPTQKAHKLKTHKTKKPKTSNANKREPCLSHA